MPLHLLTTRVSPSLQDVAIDARVVSLRLSSPGNCAARRVKDSFDCLHPPTVPSCAYIVSFAVTVDFHRFHASPIQQHLKRLKLINQILINQAVCHGNLWHLFLHSIHFCLKTVLRSAECEKLKVSHPID